MNLYLFLSVTPTMTPQLLAAVTTASKLDSIPHGGTIVLGQNHQASIPTLGIPSTAVGRPINDPDNAAKVSP
jgi:hypothetical protein